MPRLGDDGRNLKQELSMAVPSDRRYSESHEWFRVEGNMVTVGITKHATDELTDITYVEMNPVGTDVSPGGAVGEVESVKTTAEVFSVVGGTIREVNETLGGDPSILNEDPYDAGWLLKLEVDDTSALDGLMDDKAYEQLHG